MASHLHHQKSHEEDAREHLFASLNREPNNELDALLRSPSDTILYTKSLPSNNFYAGTYGAAGPSTATASSPQSQALFSARTGTYTEPTTYSTSNKGKSRSKQKEVDVLSVGATKGSSADEISALTSGSDTDKSGPIALKDAGSHFEPGIAKKAVRGRKKYKVSLHHGDRKSDLNLIDTRVALKNRPAAYHAQSSSEGDVEADGQPADKRVSMNSQRSKMPMIISTSLVCCLLAIIGALFFDFTWIDGQSSTATSITVIAMLVVSIPGLPMVVVWTNRHEPIVARCLFSAGMVLLALMASLLALSLGRPAVECYMVLISILTFSILLRGELDTLLSWK